MAWLRPTVVVVFPFAERSRRDRCDDNVFSVGSILQPLSNREMNFSFGLSVHLQFVRQDACFGRNFVDRDRCGGLRDIDITWNACKYILQLMRHSLSSLYLVKTDYGIQTRGR